jgi:hypothetical protein
MKKRIGLIIALTVIFSLAIGYVNIHANEVQAPVLTILVLTFLLGCLDPRRAWLWAICLGGAVPLSYALAPIFGYLVPYPPDPNIFASFIALIPAFIGAYAGVLARRVAFSASDHPAMN